MGPGKGVLSHGREENYVRAYYDTVRSFESKERLDIAYALSHLVARCSFSTPLLYVPRSLKNDYPVFCRVLYLCGARGGVVVKALRYKPAGRGFDFRWCHWNFSVT